MTRAETQKQQRRRRNTDALRGNRGRTMINESALDKENFTYYLARTDQIADLTTNDDWEVVANRDGNIKENGMGAEVAIPSGTDAEGRAERLVLLKKPRQFHEEDEQRRLQRAEELERGMIAKTGSAPGDRMDITADSGV